MLFSASSFLLLFWLGNEYIVVLQGDGILGSLFFLCYDSEMGVKHVGCGDRLSVLCVFLMWL